MVVDHQLRQLRAGQRVVAHLGLRIHQADEIVSLLLRPQERLDGQVQHLEHRLVLGPADDAAVGGCRSHASGLGQEESEPAGAGHGVRVGVVVRHNQGALVSFGDREQLAEAVAQGEAGGVIGEPL